MFDRTDAHPEPNDQMGHILSRGHGKLYLFEIRAKTLEEATSIYTQLLWALLPAVLPL